jgi:Domain of unknown function (DUF5664)
MDQRLPVGSQARKDVPVFSGVLAYFPDAICEIAKLSKAGNDKHNPGQPLHWARGKSMDHADCILRHLIDHGTVDAEDGIRHSVKVAWRALALLQEELERDLRLPLPRGARGPDAPAKAPEEAPVVDKGLASLQYIQRQLMRGAPGGIIEVDPNLVLVGRATPSASPY